MEGYMTLHQTFLLFQYGLIMVMPLVVLSEFHSIPPNYLGSDSSLVPVHPRSRLLFIILVYGMFTDLR